jgi:hypothetical protein
MDRALESLKNEVHRKLGRNIILFQKIELLLKFLLANSKISGYIDDLKIIQERQNKTFEKQTLGQLVNQFFANIIFSSTKIDDEPDVLKGVWINFDCKFLNDSSVYEEQKKSLVLVVAERNELVHHFFLKWDLTLVDGWNSAEHYLDKQYDKIENEFQRLKVLAELLEEGTKDIGNFMKTDEGKAWLKFQFMTSKLVNLLDEITVKKSRSDGWTLLSHAEKILREEVPEEIDLLKKQYKQKTLKNWMMSIELFDFDYEITKKGGTRVLYRIKSN